MQSARTLVAALALSLVTAGCGPASGDPSNPMPLPALPQSEIQLSVDRLGITHVYARSDRDVFFGAGYAMARDRLFQMELNRRRARGTLSELLGRGSLADDRQARAIGFARLGEADAALLRAEAPADAALLDAWAQGVNLRIDEIASGKSPRPYGLGGGELDHVPEHWSLGDAASVGKLLAFGLSNTLDQDLLASVVTRLAAKTLEHFPLLQPGWDISIVSPPQGTNGKSAPLDAAHSNDPAFDFESLNSNHPDWRKRLSDYHEIAPGLASNNWAVDGAHSQNGRPLLCGDPHQNLTSPQNFWPVHMNSADGGGTFDVIGFIFPGTPTVELGHNAHLGWTATTAYADVMDLWDVDVGGFDHVTLGGVSHPLNVRHQIIHVRRDGAAYGQSDDEPFDTWESPGQGVLLTDELLPVPRAFIAKQQILFNWVGFRPTHDALAYLSLDRARNLDDFEAAADLLQVGAVNFVAADKTGIDYRVHAIVPDRGDPASHQMPWHILDGSDAASLWTKELPSEKLPRSRNPARGYLSSANNDPFGFTFDNDLTNDPFYYGSFYADANRAHRIDESLSSLLENGNKVSRADMEKLQDDLHSDEADTLIPLLAKAVSAIDTSPALARYRNRPELILLSNQLTNWNRDFDRNLQEPVIFLAVEWFAARRAFSDKITASLFNAIATKSSPYFLSKLRMLLAGKFKDPEYFIPDGVDALLVSSLADAADFLKARFGGLDNGAFKLSDFSLAAFASPYGHDLNPTPIPVSGGPDTIFVDEAPFFDPAGMPLRTTSAREVSLYRMALQFGDDGTPEATIDIARGTSGDPHGRHFSDLESDWQSGKHVPLPFRRADVDASTVEKATLPAAR